ncbi:DUF3021 domain-containing protein [Lysinibacillus sp. LZ02]|uniref:DUF3021 domain-containing protein n=1 Tax=Lysinibacillus sp. LZ02 TaxID=3420668 RepID=UPI003D369159
MHMMKYLLFGVSWGCTAFVFMNVIGYVIGGDAFLQVLAENYLGHVFGSILVGISCATTSIVYSIERLTFLQQTFIHFSVGLSTFFIVAFSLKWIPVTSVPSLIGIIIGNILMFTFVWFLFYLYNRHEARKMNKKISAFSSSE